MPWPSLFNVLMFSTCGDKIKGSTLVANSSWDLPYWLDPGICVDLHLQTAYTFYTSARCPGKQLNFRGTIIQKYTCKWRPSELSEKVELPFNHLVVVTTVLLPPLLPMALWIKATSLLTAVFTILFTTTAEHCLHCGHQHPSSIDNTIPLYSKLIHVYV